MKRLFSLSLFVSYFLCGLLHAQSYFPEVGSAAVHQRTLDLKSNLHVLSIALQPGFEDLASLAYFRMGKGAKVMSVYATNGEGGESDVRSEYPPQLAAVRREEAAKALRHLGGEVYFLNLVDIPSAVNTEEIREQWHADSVQNRLMKIISQFRPDLILIARDQESEGPSVRWKVLVEDVLRSVERLRFQIGDTPPKELPPFARWTVNRVLSDDGTGMGVGLPIATSHTVWKKTYDVFAKEAAQQYASMQLQRSQWNTAKRVLYQTVYPKGAKKLRTPDEGLPEVVPAELQPIKLLVDKVVLGASTLSEAQASSRPRALQIGRASCRERV